MNDDISNKVKALLEDPEMIAKIATIASSLGLGNSAATNSSVPVSNNDDNANYDNSVQANSASSNPPTANINPSVKSDPRMALLNSIKPFLRSERQPKVDNLTRALTVANLFGSLKDKKQ